MTRRVNILADKSLLAAFAHDRHGVTEKEARAAIRDSDFFRPQGASSKFRLAGAGVIAGLIAGGASGWLIQTLTARTQPTEIGSVGANTPTTPRQTVTSSATDSKPQLNIEESAQSANVGVNSTPDSPEGEFIVATPSRRELPPGQSNASAIADTALLDKRSASAPTKDSRTVNEASLVRDSSGTKNLGRLTRARYEETQAWLGTAGDKLQSIQLLTVSADGVSRLERFLLKAFDLLPPENFHVYSVKIDGQQHYRVAYGAYKDAAEAKAALHELPALLKAQHPYIRSAARMNSQNKQ